MKRVVVLWSTGSIGTQALDLIHRFPEHLRVVGLAAGHWSAAFEEQIERWNPELAAIGESRPWTLSHEIPLLAGEQALENLVGRLTPDVLVLGTPGLVGLPACLAALQLGATVLVANKETLVAAGALVWDTARSHNASVLPVDSEHSGIWQCLRGEERETVAELILTSSGGALRDVPLAELPGATPAQALQHPTWRMGPKITIDSATLMNKGLEIIEASRLFDLPAQMVSVVLHRQSIVHALVEFQDGSLKAQLSVPDMRLAILHALMYPERPSMDLPRLDLLAVGALTFEPIDDARYPAIGVAREAARAGGSYPAVLNAANEVAVERFLAGDIRFTDIVPLVYETLGRHQPSDDRTLDSLLATDSWAREICRAMSPSRAHTPLGAHPGAGRT